MYQAVKEITVTFICDGQAHAISGAEEWRSFTGKDGESAKSVRDELVKELKAIGWRFFKENGEHKCLCNWCVADPNAEFPPKSIFHFV